MDFNKDTQCSFDTFTFKFLRTLYREFECESVKTSLIA